MQFEKIMYEVAIGRRGGGGSRNHERGGWFQIQLANFIYINFLLYMNIASRLPDSWKKSEEKNIL